MSPWETPVTDPFAAYFARLPDDQRAALEKLRTQINKAAPGAEEAIGYGIPCFKLHGALVSIGAAKTHVSLYGMSPKVFADLAEEFDRLGLDYSKGTLRFQPEKPIPAKLVERIVKARIAENIALRTATKERAKAKAAAKKAPAKKK